MTLEQWKKVVERALALSGGSPGDPAFLLAVRDLTVPADEAQLDVDNAMRRQANKDAEIAALEKRLEDLKR